MDTSKNRIQGQDIGPTKIRMNWAKKPKKHFSFFCPACRSARSLAMDPRPGRLRHILQVGITSVFIAAVAACFAPWMAWKALLSFIPLWIVFEVFYRARVRSIAACQYCGFDPFLYLSDAQRAKQAIHEHLQRRYEEKGLEYPRSSRNDAQALKELPEA